MAGARGFEPLLTVLETVVLPLTLCPYKDLLNSLHLYSDNIKIMSCSMSQLQLTSCKIILSICTYTNR